MAQLTIDIPNAVASRVADALCNNNGYTGTYNGQPETKLAFAKRWLINIIRNEVRVYETRVAQDNAEATVRNDIQNNITLS